MAYFFSHVACLLLVASITFMAITEGSVVWIITNSVLLTVNSILVGYGLLRD